METARSPSNNKFRRPERPHHSFSLHQSQRSRRTHTKARGEGSMQQRSQPSNEKQNRKFNLLTRGEIPVSCPAGRQRRWKARAKVGSVQCKPQFQTGVSPREKPTSQISPRRNTPTFALSLRSKISLTDSHRVFALIAEKINRTERPVGLEIGWPVGQGILTAKFIADS